MTDVPDQHLKEVFIDYEPPTLNISDEAAAEILLSKFQPILGSIGERTKQISRIGIAYDTASVALYDQVKDLYYLGYFASAIIVCRSIAEYLAYEIFFEEVEIDGERELIESIAENLDFRKIVNEFLYNRKKGYSIIDQESCKLFNDLYSLGNKWVHPRKVEKGVNIEQVAFQSIEMLNALMSSLRDVMKDYDIAQGALKAKPTARKKVRPMIMKAK